MMRRPRRANCSDRRDDGTKRRTEHSRNREDAQSQPTQTRRQTTRCGKQQRNTRRRAGPGAECGHKMGMHFPSGDFMGNGISHARGAWEGPEHAKPRPRKELRVAPSSRSGMAPPSHCAASRSEPQRAKDARATPNNRVSPFLGRWPRRVAATTRSPREITRDAR